MAGLPLRTRVISTVHKTGWDQYGQAWLDGIQFWPEDTEFVLYTEGFKLEHDRVKSIDIDSIPRAWDFKKKYWYYKPVLWTWDVVRWSNKVFANCHGTDNFTGTAIWLDCDCVTYKPIKPYLDSIDMGGAYLALFKRAGIPSETGFVIRDCSSDYHKPFMSAWAQWLETGAFKTLDQWCDAATMDATMRLFEKQQGLRSISLSEGYDKDLNPMDKASISQYLVHRKGERKWQPKEAEEALR